MMDGRRHSVDIPISRTLVALRRVRSLRDPSTNSMSKFSALVENANWETNSTNGISLRFANGSRECAPLDSTVAENEQDRKQVDGFQAHPQMGRPDLVNCQDPSLVGDAFPPTWLAKESNYHEGECKELVQSKTDVLCYELTDKSLDLACLTPSNHMEDVGSCSERTVGSLEDEKVKHTASERNSHYRIQRRSCGVVGDVSSCVGSPRTIRTDAFLEGSSRSASLFANDEVDDAVEHFHYGRGMGCCWSGTPKFKRSNALSDLEDRPLLVGDANLARETWRDNESIPYSETQTHLRLGRSLKPRSFNELVGQDAVARSLLSSITTGRIPAIYLLHGPRGTGKTCASRLLAASLNCLMLNEHGPCGRCTECVELFSGRSRDVKEVDSMRVNHTDRARSLLRCAAVPPSSSRFKVFIFDECHLLRGETWAMILNGIETLPQHVVYIMTTSELDKLPRSAMSRSQRYHFPKIKDADIATRLCEICVEECVEFEKVALEFIAAKSSGSLRDAEMMLDQLSLLGKRITLPLVYELMGTVPDDELLELLALALSSDTSSTVIRARELMRSRIDPMQLISQLANLIMDILSAQSQELGSEARREFSKAHTSEADLHKLTHALKILSETEKQLRTSKNQTTWLTVALLQLSSSDSSSLEEPDSRCCSRNVEKDIDGECCSRPSTEDSKKHFIPHSRNCKKSCILGAQMSYRENLDFIWGRVTERCHSRTLKRFLVKHGKLSSLHLDHGAAVANLDFDHPDYVMRAEKSWKAIASSLQSILGCNIEIRINLLPFAAGSKHAKVKKAYFNLFSCSRRMQQETLSTAEKGSESDYSDCTCDKYKTSEKPKLSCSSDFKSQMQHICDHQVGPVSSLRNEEGNILSVGTETSQRLLHNFERRFPEPVCGCSGGEPIYCGHQSMSIHEPEVRSNCFPRVRKSQKMPNMPDTLQMICHNLPEKNKLSLPISARVSSETPSCSGEPYLFCSSEACTSVSRGVDIMRDSPDLLCWRTPILPVRKAWGRRHERQGSHFVEWVLPCAAAK